MADEMQTSQIIAKTLTRCESLVIRQNIVNCGKYYNIITNICIIYKTRNCECKTEWLWVRSPLEEMKYLLKFKFPFLRSGVEAKRGVGLCHLTRNASRIRQKVGNAVSFTKFLLPTLLCAGYSVKLMYNIYVCAKIVIIFNVASKSIVKK